MIIEVQGIIAIKIWPINHKPLSQKLDLFLPQIPANLLHLVVLIQWGSWKAGLHKDYQDCSKKLAQRDYAAATYDYQLFNEAQYPALVEDVRTAIKRLRDKVNDYPHNLNRVPMFGDSAIKKQSI